MLDRSKYVIKEHVGLLKMRNKYDILDPADGDKIGEAEEQIPGWVVLLSLFLNRQFLPTSVVIRDAVNNEDVLTLHRPFSLWRAKVRILDSEGAELGYFKAKMFSLGGGFYVYNNEDELVAEIKGDWKGWNFKFIDSDGQQIGTVAKKWAGLGKELFTSADTYMISLEDSGEDHESRAALLLASGIAIDTIFKEGK